MEIVKRYNVKKFRKQLKPKINQVDAAAIMRWSTRKFQYQERRGFRLGDFCEFVQLVGGKVTAADGEFIAKIEGNLFPFSKYVMDGKDKS